MSSWPWVRKADTSNSIEALTDTHISYLSKARIMTQSRLSLIRTLHILVLDTEHKDNADRTVFNDTALTRHLRHSTWYTPGSLAWRARTVHWPGSILLLKSA